MRITPTSLRRVSATTIVLALSLVPAMTYAQSNAAVLIQTIDTALLNPPSPDPAGITYLDDPASPDLLVSDSEVEETPLFAGVNLFGMTVTGTLTDLLSTLTPLSFSEEPTGVVYRASDGHLLVADDNGRVIYDLDPSDDGLFGTADDTVTSFSTANFGSDDPEGITLDPDTGALFVVDGVGTRVYRIDPGPNAVLDGGGDDVITSFDTTVLGLEDPEGIAFEPTAGTLYLVGQPTEFVVEATTNGTFVRIIDISSANAVTPAGLTFAPSSDETDDPQTLNLYIADRGVDNDSGAGADPDENDGKIYEVALPVADVPTVDVWVSSSSDDAEENENFVNLSSTDLELTFDFGVDQLIGIRFADVAIPVGATVQHAHVQLVAKRANESDLTNLLIEGESSADPLTFTGALGSVANRPRTQAAVAWSPATWVAIGDAGSAQRTPDLTTVIQEIVDGPGWAPGNAMALILTGSGLRTAYAFDRNAAVAPRLHVEYALAGNAPPVALDDAFTTDEDSTLSGDVLINDTDPDNGDTLVVSAVNGDTGAPGNELVLGSGALLNLDTDGTFSYDPNGQFEGLNTGDTATDTFSYTLSDGNDTDTATVIITITGNNDAPVITALTDVVVTEQTSSQLTLAGFDPDSATLTFGFAGTPPAFVSLTDNGAGAGFLTLAPGSGDAGEHTLTVTLTDDGSPSQSATTTFTVTVNPPTSGSGRVTDGLQVLYTFDAADGDTVFDQSGVGTPLNLTIANINKVTWGVGTLSVDGSTSITSNTAASKVSTAVAASNEVTLEAWITPQNITQTGPARIVTLSESSRRRNLTLGQGGTRGAPGTRYDVRLLTTTTNNNGIPSLATPNGSLDTNLTHFIYTRAADGTARIYLDGALSAEGDRGGNLSNWKTNYDLILANENAFNRPWLGIFDLVAIYDRALSSSEVNQNFNAGPDGTAGQ